MSYNKRAQRRQSARKKINRKKGYVFLLVFVFLIAVVFIAYRINIQATKKIKSMRRNDVVDKLIEDDEERYQKKPSLDRKKEFINNVDGINQDILKTQPPYSDKDKDYLDTLIRDN